MTQFQKENKKILASHTSTFKETNRVEKKKSNSEAKKVMKKLEEAQQQSTLGDLDGLAALKEDLESNE